MFVFGPDPHWFAKYWLSEQPYPRRVSLVGAVTRFAVVIALLVGSATLSHF